MGAPETCHVIGVNVKARTWICLRCFRAFRGSWPTSRVRYENDFCWFGTRLQVWCINNLRANLGPD